MRAITSRLAVGSEYDYESHAVRPDWSYVLAAKEPWHRRAAGYTTRSLPKDHPDYLYVRHRHTLSLNLVDAPDPAYVAPELVETALTFIHDELTLGRFVAIHCNQGVSRSPTLALLYLGRYTDLLDRGSFDNAVEQFRQRYPDYGPGLGMLGFARAWWATLAEGG